MSGDWEHGLCSCCEDTHVCCISYLWPNLQLMQQRATIEGRQCEFIDCLCATFCFPCAACHVRHQITEKHGIDENIIMNILSVCCCTLCAITQHTRQLQAKGEKPSAETSEPLCTCGIFVTIPSNLIEYQVQVIDSSVKKLSVAPTQTPTPVNQSYRLLPPSLLFKVANILEYGSLKMIYLNLFS
ncbi:hypothetical protein PPL_00065 [Heterostelium album PN500]|uniref:Uncharacterized protein n=1 Tax=Heterostelium pallidum (strain ATCC 26659 / Pp 5 / PN500) TaxID=670386 RepID=D3BVR2_HETP5|nr:hypothetical protein PPL_00065 [Heterostelium album PN500]EFA74565.1 hypothetical protein PPL_00065 [Heterostelium album PN500]|eukprot:XP_020426699.1 hypothetical protein PPL_00065 [Heterostelium album PN500]